MNKKEQLIKHLKFFLINKLFLLRKEVHHIKWSMNYIKSLDKQLNGINSDSDNKKDTSQFIKDCNLIISFINMIDNGIDNIMNKLSDSNLKNKTIIELIILFDCINARINNSILKKFDYVYKSYENLILSYNHLYVPTTSISKLAKTPNLMLFFNKKLNQISKIFSELVKNSHQNIKDVFSTWNFIDTDHLADFYDEDNKVYIELSFWLYEMPIFHCIAIHEIYHKYYFEDYDLKFTRKDLKFIKENLPNIIKQDIVPLIENFPENFIISLYQEILADLHTYIFVKESYLYTLFLNGFLSEISHNFLGVDSSNENISFESKCCFDKIGKMSIYNFDFKKKQILYFVRLFFLLKYIKRYDKEIYNSEIVKFIEDILLIVFPDDTKPQNYSTLNDLLKDFTVYKNYNKNKYIIHILTETYYKLFLKDLSKKFKVINKRREKLEKLDFCQNYKQRFNKIFINEINSISIDDEKNKYIKINHLIQEEFRKNNIEELLKNQKNKDDIIKELLKSLENQKNNIYFLTNIKLSRNNTDDAFLLANNILNKYNNYFYSFGPFDFVRLEKKSEKFVEELEIELNNYTFFIDNHSLFHIKTYNNSSNDANNDDPNSNPKIFNLLLSIDIKKAFSDENNEQNIFIAIDEILSDKTINKYKAQLFFSMGNENLVIFISDIAPNNLSTIIEEFHKIIHISHISSTILLNKRFFELLDKEDLILQNLIILIKLKPDSENSLFSQYETLKDEINKTGINDLKLFKKLGVYDAKIILKEINFANLKKLIKSISPLTRDIQIEKEIEIYN
jgi:hypothetical protein